MKENLTISLPKKIRTELEKVARDEGLSKSEIVKSALQDYLFIRKFQELRAKMMAKAQANGIFTDEDVFEKVS